MKERKCTYNERDEGAVDDDLEDVPEGVVRSVRLNILLIIAYLPSNHDSLYGVTKHKPGGVGYICSARTQRAQ